MDDRNTLLSRIDIDNEIKMLRMCNLDIVKSLFKDVILKRIKK